MRGSSEFRNVKKNCLQCGKELVLECNLHITRKKFCSRTCCGKYNAILHGTKPPATKTIRYQKKCKNCQNDISWDTINQLCRTCFNKTKKIDSSFICNGCQKEIVLPPNKIRESNGFCSRQCKKEWKIKNGISRKIKVNCDYCGKEFEKYPSLLTGKKHFCSYLCNSIFHGKERYKDHVYTLSLRKLIRRCGEYKRWKRKLLEKANFQCQECASKIDLHIHHKYPFAKIFNEFVSLYDKAELENTGYMLDEARNFDKFWDENNGIILCRDCHQKIHPNLVLTH